MITGRPNLKAPRLTSGTLKVSGTFNTDAHATLACVSRQCSFRTRSSGTIQAFPVQADEHFYSVCRYVERNALKANLVKSADKWHWSSLYRWLHGSTADKELLSAWPLPRKRSWLDHVNAPLTESEYTQLQLCVQRGCPFGDDHWNARKIKQLGLESTITPRGRPRRIDKGS